MTEKNTLKEILALYLENPYWREYYETAPTELCREYIALEFYLSDYESEEALAEIRRIEDILGLDDWRHLYKYCGNNPRKKLIRDRIRELGGE